MSGKIFLGRTTGQVPDQSSKHPETARMVFTGTPWEWLCPKWSPHWSLKQISKENVRLFCSGSVICHTKRLSLTSGDVSCTLCRTDLLPADMPVLSMQLSPCTLCPPLSAHTSAVFLWQPVWHGQEWKQFLEKQISLVTIMNDFYSGLLLFSLTLVELFYQTTTSLLSSVVC